MAQLIQGRQLQTIQGINTDPQGKNWKSGPFKPFTQTKIDRTLSRRDPRRGTSAPAGQTKTLVEREPAGS